MTEISHIVSSDLLDLIDGRKFYMCLCNVCIKNQTYKDFYKKQVEKGAFVLMDLGTAENDRMAPQTMLEMINYIHPTEIILSDVLLDCDETLRQSEKALQFYEDNKVNCQFMLAVQGKNFDEWKRCLESFKQIDKITTIGVSKFVTSGWNDDNARLKCCKLINELYPEKQIHLLGCHKNINEVAEISKQCKNIRSNDTAFAQICAMNNQSILNGNRPSGIMNFIESNFDTQQIEILKENINLYDNLMKQE